MNGHFMFVTVILHILRPNSIVFVVSRTLLPLYYQANIVQRAHAYCFNVQYKLKTK